MEWGYSQWFIVSQITHNHIWKSFFFILSLKLHKFKDVYLNIFHITVLHHGDCCLHDKLDIFFLFFHLCMSEFVFFLSVCIFILSCMPASVPVPVSTEKICEYRCQIRAGRQGHVLVFTVLHVLYKGKGALTNIFDLSSFTSNLLSFMSCVLTSPSIQGFS